ncbi:MAG TPA: hypothetical protein VF618_24330 [Thermoanaerobaculia bacterium]
MTIESFNVPSTSMPLLSGATGDDAAMMLAAIGYALRYSSLGEMNAQAIEAGLQEAGCTNVDGWEPILASFFNAAGQTSAGASYVGYLGPYPPAGYTSLVFLLIANPGNEPLTIDTSSDATFYCDFGDPALVTTSIPSGNVGAFLFVSDDRLAGTEGAMAVYVGNGTNGYSVGWLDPHSGSNGCLIDFLQDDPMNLWYQQAVIKCGGQATSGSVGMGATAVINATSGPNVAMVVAMVG